MKLFYCIHCLGRNKQVNCKHFSNKSKKIITLICRNCCESYFNVNFLSEITETSRQHIYDILIKDFNISPKKLINKLRIERSILLFSNDKLKFYEIAEKSGFQNIRCYRQVFKDFMKHPPMQIREEILQTKHIINITQEYIMKLWI